MSDDIKKFEAFQGLVARHYVPTFVEKLASHGMVFETEEELAHALQLNGKFAAVISDGVSLDTLVDAISTRLNTTKFDNLELTNELKFIQSHIILFSDTSLPFQGEK